MTMYRTWPTQAGGGTPIADTRALQAGMFLRSAAGVPRTGVLPAHTGPLVVGTSSMAYSVAAFVGLSSRQLPGAELIGNDGAALTPQVPVVTANRRLDVIWARARYPLYGDGSVVEAEIGVTTGQQSSASPLPKNSIPPGALELATAEIPASAQSTSASGVIITPTHAFTALEGGTVLLRSQADQDAWVPHEGSLAYRLDTQRGYEYLGAAIGWVHAFGKPEIGTFTPAGIYSPGTGSPFRLLISGGRVAPEGNIVSSSAGFTAGDNYTFGSVSAAMAPKTAQIVAGLVNVDGLAEITFATTGLITGKFNKSFNGALNLWINAGGWADKRLV